MGYVKPWQIKLDMKDQNSYVNTNVVVNNANNTLQFDIFVNDDGKAIDYGSFHGVTIASQKSNGFKVVTDSSHSSGIVEILGDRIRWTLSSPVLSVEGIVKNELYLINNSEGKKVVATLRFNFSVQLCLLADVVVNDSNYINGLEDMFGKTEELMESLKANFDESMDSFEDKVKGLEEDYINWKDTIANTSTDEIMNSIDEVKADVTTLNKSLSELDENLSDTTEQLSEFINETNLSMTEISGDLTGLNTTVNNLADGLNQLSNKIQENSEKISLIENNLYNPNLLINSNFKVSSLVNQRGFDNYKNYGYGIDMWPTMGTGVDYSIDLSGEYFRFTNNFAKHENGNNHVNFGQFLEDTNFEGTYTISAKIRGDIGKKLYLWAFVDGRWIGKSHVFKATDWEFLKLTVKPSSTIRHVVLQPQDAMSFEINYIKMEKGEYATPFIDDDMATKLVKCQRFLRIIDKTNDERVVHNEILRNEIYFIYKYSQMRVPPNVVIENNPVVYCPYLGGELTGFNFVVLKSCSGFIAISAKKSNHGVTALDVPILPLARTDTRIILSAEL